MKAKPHEILNQKRKALDLTIMDLSEKAEVSFSSVQRLCKGHGRQVSLKIKEAVAFALEANPFEIWADEFSEFLEERKRLYKMAEAQQVELVKKAKAKGTYYPKETEIFDPPLSIEEQKKFEKMTPDQQLAYNKKRKKKGR